MATLTFMGADHTVTGSKHLLTMENHKLLIDCGLYQGIKALRLRNWEALPVAADTINSIAITHAHIDHTGFLPRLMMNGFKGNIYATPATCDLASIMLPDSGRLQEEEARYANKKGSSKHTPALPLYTEQDAKAVLSHFSPVHYDTPFQVAEGLTITCRQAGHILGSALIEAEIREKGETIKVLFSGDLGRENTPILKDPAIVSDTDYLLLEATYGDRLHAVADRKEALKKVVRETLSRKGVLLIPAFAVERTQELLYILNLLNDASDIPKVPIYIDSPMAVSVTRIFSRYRNVYDDEALALLGNGKEILESPLMKFCETVDQSKALNEKDGPMIILSASGMATGGRILHHLANRLPDPKNTVLLVGYQAEGTRGRLLQEGAAKLKFYGDEVKVKAQIASIDGFSSHADYKEILSWLGHFTKPPRKTFLVHGEPDSLAGLQKRITEALQWNVEVAEFGKTLTL